MEFGVDNKYFAVVVDYVEDTGDIEDIEDIEDIGVDAGCFRPSSLSEVDLMVIIDEFEPVVHRRTLYKQ